MPEREPSALHRLEADGLLRRSGDRLRTTARWQSAMARAAYRLAGPRGENDRGDIRVAIVTALIDLYGPDLEDQTLVDLVEAILPIELAELAPPRAHSPPA